MFCSPRYLFPTCHYRAFVKVYHTRDVTWIFVVNSNIGGSLAERNQVVSNALDRNETFGDHALSFGVSSSTLLGSGVERAFPVGRVAHPEDQNEEGNKENSRKNERKIQENEENKKQTNKKKNKKKNKTKTQTSKLHIPRILGKKFDCTYFSPMSIKSSF